MTERLVGSLGSVEVVPVQQDGHQEQDSVEEPVRAGSGERRGWPARGPGCTSAPAASPASTAASSDRMVCARARQGAWLGPSRSRGMVALTAPAISITTAPSQQGRRVLALAAVQRLMYSEAGQSADGGHDAAGRGRYGVRDHQLVLGDYMRQRRGQRGQEEPVHAEHREHADIQRDAELAGRDQPGGDDDEDRPEQGGADQDLAPGPPVNEDSGKRADQRVRQVQHRERGRSRGRVREVRCVEKDITA